MKARNYSRKREAILAKIRSTDCHPTAEWVHRELKDDFPDLSLGTVYRNISLFKEEGQIVSVGTVDGQERFDACVEPHGHFICRRCRAVVDIDAPLEDLDVADSLEETMGVSVERVDLTVYGVCNACLEAE